jgi:cytochrome c peroxidase
VFKRKILFVLTAIFVFLLVTDIACSKGGELEPVKDVPAPMANPQSPDKVELGKKLFFDRRLSGDGTMSCATCHMPEQGFSDAQAISLSYPTTKNWRNTPTLINVAFSKSLFHDGRSGTLEEQALFPIMSAFEMNQNLDFLEEEIRSVPEYVEAFAKVFGTEDVTRERIAMAIAAFERSLVSRNSPLDKYLNGDKTALSELAKKGLELFRGKGRCIQCHHGVNLMDDQFYALHVPENPDFQKDPRVAATRRFVAKVNDYKDFKTLEEDPGRYLISKNKEDWRAFKTPTLRDIARTAPYMHNGTFETLDEVIDFFDRGGGEGNRVLKPLGLTEEEKGHLKAFLTEALAGEEITIIHPKLP